jgi:hypothetical protein
LPWNCYDYCNIRRISCGEKKEIRRIAREKGLQRVMT